MLVYQRVTWRWNQWIKGARHRRRRCSRRPHWKMPIGWIMNRIPPSPLYQALPGSTRLYQALLDSTINHSWYQVLVLMCGADLQLTSTIWVWMKHLRTIHRIAIVGSPSQAIASTHHRHIVLRRAAFTGLKQDGKVYNWGGCIFHIIPSYSIIFPCTVM